MTRLLAFYYHNSVRPLLRSGIGGQMRTNKKDHPNKRMAFNI
ncbi:hypothetical protein [Mucilaginibacter frigoritolerans]|nr:hypothetical protein [Mucilaginibacter frigoritolerans]